MRFWASQRLVENAFRRFVAYAQGTWLTSVWLRCLGAKVGSWATFRFCNAQVPTLSSPCLCSPRFTLEIRPQRVHQTTLRPAAVAPPSCREPGVPVLADHERHTLQRLQS